MQRKQGAYSQRRDHPPRFGLGALGSSNRRSSQMAGVLGNVDQDGNEDCKDATILPTPERSTDVEWKAEL
jgi:hypothetical protein